MGNKFNFTVYPNLLNTVYMQCRDNLVCFFFNMTNIISKMAAQNSRWRLFQGVLGPKIMQYRDNLVWKKRIESKNGDQSIQDGGKNILNGGCFEGFQALIPCYIGTQ